MFQYFLPCTSIIKIRFQFGGREVSLAESIIPEEAETMQAIIDCLNSAFMEIKKPLEVWVRGDYMDYSFEVTVNSKSLKKRVDETFSQLNTKLASI